MSQPSSRSAASRRSFALGKACRAKKRADAIVEGLVGRVGVTDCGQCDFGVAQQQPADDYLGEAFQK